MAPEEEPEKTRAVEVKPRREENSATGSVSPYFLLMSVRVTPFGDAFRLTMVGVKEPEGIRSVEVTARCTAQGPVSISVGTALR